MCGKTFFFPSSEKKDYLYGPFRFKEVTNPKKSLTSFCLKYIYKGETVLFLTRKGANKDGTRNPRIVYKRYEPFLYLRGKMTNDRTLPTAT